MDSISKNVNSNQNARWSSNSIRPNDYSSGANLSGAGENLDNTNGDAGPITNSWINGRNAPGPSSVGDSRMNGPRENMIAGNAGNLISNNNQQVSSNLNVPTADSSQASFGGPEERWDDISGDRRNVNVLENARNSGDTRRDLNDLTSGPELNNAGNPNLNTPDLNKIEGSNEYVSNDSSDKTNLESSEIRFVGSNGVSWNDSPVSNNTSEGNVAPSGGVEAALGSVYISKDLAKDGIGGW